jgi:hypothetical protein
MSISVGRMLTPGAGALLRARDMAGRESARGAIASLCGPSAGRLEPIPHLRQGGPAGLRADRAARVAHLGHAAGADHVARPDYLPTGRGERLFDIGRRRPVAACMVEGAPRTGGALAVMLGGPRPRGEGPGGRGNGRVARGAVCGMKARDFSGEAGPAAERDPDKPLGPAYDCTG